MTNSTVLKGRSMGIAFAALVLLALAMAPVSVFAADLGGYSYDYSYPIDTGYSYDYSYPIYDSGYSYDYSYPLYSSDYSYYTPSYYTPSSYSYYTPSYAAAPSYAVSSVYAPSNTEVCNAPNSCNDNSVFNAPTVVTVTDYSKDYGSKKKSYDRDYDYNRVSYRAPYVTLSQVPYTGLELGPVGTALYWSFLVVWCLIAAYLIAVKRVQNTILRKLNVFLFGDATPAPVTPAPVGLSRGDLEALASMLRSEVKPAAPVAPSQGSDKTDEFVLSQINRARR